jgi:predicted transcriptional regulator
MAQISAASNYDPSGPICIETFIAGEAITEGDVVILDHTDENGYTVLQSNADSVAIGVAQEDAADGAEVKVQTYGLGIKAITTGGSAAANSSLIAGASGATAEVAAGTAAYAPFAYALEADSSTTLAAEDYFITFGPVYF